MLLTDAIKLIRYHAQLSPAVLSDSFITDLLDDTCAQLFLSVSNSNPSLVWGSAIITYPAQAEKYELEITRVRVRTVISVGEHTQNSARVVIRAYKPTQWVEIDADVAEPVFHYDGRYLRVRPIPQAAVRLHVRYVPFYTSVLDDPTDVLFEGYPHLTELLSTYACLRVAYTIRSTRGLPTDQLAAEISARSDVLSKVLGTSIEFPVSLANQAAYEPRR